MGKRWCVFSVPGLSARKSSFLLAVGFLIAAPVYAQKVEPAVPAPPAYDVEVLSNGASNGFKVGDEIRLKVRNLDLPGGTDPQKELAVEPSPGENLFQQGWNLKQVPGSPAQPGQFEFTGIPVKPGKLTLPSLTIKDSKGNAIARTNPQTLDVASAIKPSDPNPAQPEPSEPPVSLDFPWWVVLSSILIGITLLGAIGYFAYRYWRNKKPKPLPVIEKPPLPEDEAALASLLELEKSGILQRGEFKKYYFKVSEILKTYIGSRYRFDAPESTTTEMIRFLEERKSVGDSIVDQLESFFEKLDRVKFSDHFPASEEQSALIQEARSFVNQTRRVPSVSPKVEGAQADAVR